MLIQGEKTRQTSQIPPGLNHFIQEIEKDAKTYWHFNRTLSSTRNKTTPFKSLILSGYTKMERKRQLGNYLPTVKHLASETSLTTCPLQELRGKEHPVANL